MRYGNMVHSVLGVDALLVEGSKFHFGPSAALDSAPARLRELVGGIHAIVEREAIHVARALERSLAR